MRTLSFALLLSLLSVNTVTFANTDEHVSKHDLPNINTVQLALENTSNTITANTTKTIRFQLLNNNKPLTLEDLKTVHTKKIHVMVIDPTLTDYYHIHPLIDNKSKDFIFKFTPKNSGSYRIWVDITPISTNKQLFLNTDIGTSSHKYSIDKQVKMNSNVGSYQFDLKLDGQPRVGKPIMAMITVTNNGKPFNELQPVMGAFAHLMGFYADYSSILHIHPMGKEPSKDSERGGSQLMFHLEPQKAGFVKLFAQFRIHEKNVYVPFGIDIKQ
ncbi:MAG: hypothetical protein EPN84_12220 [Legionella sp.]|nr:MAG: hypothetical protein EPN84_12220 [Legionella sp.]